MKVCEFCGVEVEVDPPPPPPPQRAPQPIVVHQFRSPPYVPRPSSGSPGLVIAIAMALVGVAVAIGVVVSVAGASRESRVDVSTPGVTGPGGSKRVPLSALHTTPIEWTTSIPIEAKGMVGTVEKLDVLANWDWALSVGHAWWPDADIYVVSADPIDKDGTANIASSGSVEYHLVSLACRKDHQKRAETEKDLKDSSCSLELRIDKGGPSVEMDLIAPDNTGDSHALVKPACSITQAFDQADKTGKLTKRPAYSIRLVHDVFGLEYRISNASTAASMDGVDVSPNFCVSKTATPKGTTGVVPTPVPTTQGADSKDFDQAATTRALKKADALSCATKAGPNGAARINLTFGPDGSVTSARAAPPFQGTDRGTCLERVYSGVRVPAFTGSPVNMPVTFVFSP